MAAAETTSPDAVGRDAFEHGSLLPLPEAVREYEKNAVTLTPPQPSASDERSRTTLSRVRHCRSAQADMEVGVIG